MLQQFSWGHFLIASSVLSLIWYGLVVLVFYRKEFSFFLGNGIGVGGNPVGGADENLVHAITGGDGGSGQQTSGSMMGASKLPDGVEVLSASQVAFSGANSSNRYEQVGLVADVAQELKLIFSELEKNAGDKRDFFRLLEKVKGDYGKIAGHPSIGSINAFIQESAPFHLSIEELDNLWF